MKLKGVLQVYVVIIVIICLFGECEGILGINFLGQAVFNQYYDRYWARYAGPIMDMLLGGPTYLVSKILFRSTPVINPSVLGERFDTMITGAAAGLIRLVANGISQIVRTSMSNGSDQFQSGIRAAISGFNGFIEFVFRIYESMGISASIMTYQHVTNTTKLPPSLISILKNQTGLGREDEVVKEEPLQGREYKKLVDHAVNRFSGRELDR